MFRILLSSLPDKNDMRDSNSFDTTSPPTKNSRDNAIAILVLLNKRYH